MPSRESIFQVTDFLLWCGSGALVLFFATLAARALWLGHVSINGQRATKLDEPVGYVLVIASLLGLAYLFWVVFEPGLSRWVGW
jgi:hypothetical protein